MSDSWGSTTASWTSDDWPSPPMGPTAEEAAAADDLLLGAVAGILGELGDEQGLAVLIDCQLRTQCRHSDLGVDYFDAVLLVPRHLLHAITDDRHRSIEDALRDARAFSGDEYDLIVRPLVNPASASWREDLAKRIEGGRPVNQARIGRTRIAASEDGLDFRSLQELTVYRALKLAAKKAPEAESIGIVPGAGFRAWSGNVWEPDFLVTYRGRVAAIEVDGPTHTGKAASDHSRDRLIQRSGVAFVERIAVADVDASAELDRFVSGFLRRLARP